MVLAICGLLAMAVIGFTLFVREQDIPPAPTENPELKHLETRRQVLYENLKDLQFEYHQGKLTDEDYQSLKQGFLYDLAGVMDSIDRMEIRGEKSTKPSQKAPQKTAARTKTKQETATSSNVCASCHTSNPEGNRFCGNCGKPLGA